MKKSNDSWRVDETYVKVRGQWLYLYRAADSSDQTRSKRAAKRFFRKVLDEAHVTKPRVITVDKNASRIPPRLMTSNRKSCYPRSANIGRVNI